MKGLTATVPTVGEAHPFTVRRARKTKNKSKTDLKELALAF